MLIHWLRVVIGTICAGFVYGLLAVLCYPLDESLFSDWDG